MPKVVRPIFFSDGAWETERAESCDYTLSSRDAIKDSRQLASIRETVNPKDPLEKQTGSRE